MKKLAAIFLLQSLVIFAREANAQTVNPYYMNGSASQENCNCYTLTPDQLTQSGSVWNINKINLTNSFDYRFDVFLGCADQAGADGIVFVLQPISISVGTTGEGLGLEGVSPSVGVAIDTWQNFNNQDPYGDHIAIHRNGDLNHNSPNNLAGPVPALASGENIEDCKTHSFRIVWNAVTKRLRADIDGEQRVEATIDMVKDVFNNDPMVFWGFTAATGGAKNLQRFCTALNAKFTLPADLKTCFPVTIPFKDSSSSFGEIVKWYWDFGDGTTSQTPTPSPHYYNKPGNYDVKLAILGNNGCTSDTFKQRVVVGSIPIADFALDPGIVCDSLPVIFKDQSTVQFGTINKWKWDISGAPYSVRSPGPFLFGTTGPGNSSLQVSTKEGCVSVPISKDFEVLKRPAITASFADVCKGDPVVFQASSQTQSTTIADWTWNFGDGSVAKTAATVSHLYARGGIYTPAVFATSTQGCKSFTLSDTVHVYETKANAGKDTILAAGQSYQLHGSGGDIYNWSPLTGLSDPSVSDPIVTLEHDEIFTLTASTIFGCATSDAIRIKVFKGPEIYVPNAFTPNDDGNNDRFRPLAVGMSKVLYFQVYNRYGQLIFSSTDTFSGWDGRMAGKNQPSGTYVWRVAGLDFNGQQHVKKGTVILLR